MSDEEYELIPKTMEIREVAIIVERKGFRPKKIIMTTSFLDHKKQSKSDLGDLYKQRWTVELYLRAIKTTMGMEMLRSKTPEMVKKEIWIHLLAYNAIRKIMLDAAIKKGILPGEISFKSTVQTFNHYSTLLRIQDIITTNVYNFLLDAIVKRTVGNRPGRSEPRKRKKRPKSFPLLKGSRHAGKNKELLTQSKRYATKTLVATENKAMITLS